MSFRRGLGIVVFVVGVVLLCFGINSTEKVGEKIVDSVKGRYTDTTMWYLIGGIALIIVGGTLTVRGRR